MRETGLAEIYGFANFYLVGTAAIFTAVLWGVYRFTRFGMATRAAAENERGTALLGYWLAFIGGHELGSRIDAGSLRDSYLDTNRRHRRPWQQAAVGVSWLCPGTRLLVHARQCLISVLRGLFRGLRPQDWDLR